MYGHALINHCGVNWLKSMQGNEVHNHFSGKAFGSTETIKQALEWVDFLFIAKRKRCGKVMSTHGTLHAVPTHQTVWILDSHQIIFWHP